MSPRTRSRPLTPAEARHLSAATANIGSELRDERVRRRLTLAHVADASGLSKSAVQLVESGRPAMLETYVRVAQDLGRRIDLALGPERRTPVYVVDSVHAAMGEAEARKLQGKGFEVALDEPYQHYQFAGRADLVAWERDRRVLLHIENRTRFPNLQDAFGSYGAKRAYLPGVLADRLGIAGWRVLTHVMLGLWSSEMLHVLRLRSASFRAACPDPTDAFLGWWAGDPPSSGVTSAFAVFDPARLGRASVPSPTS